MNKLISIVLIFGMVICAGIFGYFKQPLEMGLIIVAFSIGLAFLNLDKFEEFKGAGFEAKMKRVDQVVKEAAATTEQLKKLANPLILFGLNSLKYSGRVGGISHFEKDKTKRQIDALTETLKLDNPQIAKASEQYDIWTACDHIEVIGVKIESANNLVGSKLKEIAKNALTAEFDSLPTIASIERELTSLNETEKAEIAPYVDDYAYFLKNKTIRRKESLNIGYLQRW